MTVTFKDIQFFKDLSAIPIFIIISTTPYMYNSDKRLALFFSIGCLIDTIFSSFSYFFTKPMTIASVKDILGALGMMLFTIVICLTSVKPLWSYFAALVDYCSILSTRLGNRNWYEFTVFPQRLF